MKEDGAEMAGEANDLRRASVLVKSIISSSYSTKLFCHKWQLLRDKLQLLNSALETADKCGNSGENSVLVQLLQSLVSTTTDIHELVGKCSNGLYSGGKLQMNRDLDVAASELELHVNSLNEIYASGALKPARALVVSRPGAGARREDVKFYLEDLLTRLQVGDAEMKTQALATINEMLHEDEKHARILVMEVADSVDVLLRVLESKQVSIQEHAAEAISVIAGQGSCYRGILLNAGIISPLIEFADSASETVKERVTRALEKMTENADNCWSVSAHGGVTVMLKILGEVGASVELISSACGVLRNLINVHEIKRFMMEHGLVSLLINLLRSKEEGSQVEAIEFLHHLASQDNAMKDNVIEGGVVESLLKILNPNSLHSSKAREVALRAIQGLCFSSPNSITGLIHCGFLDRVLFFLRDGEISVQDSALKATFHLCRTSQVAVKKAMGDAGFMEELVKWLETKSPEAQEMAAEILCSLLSRQRNQRKFVREDHNIRKVIKLLHQVEEKPVVLKKHLLSILLSLACSYNGQRKIVSAGYVEHLEKLAENGVVDAKKILKKLSGNRFQNILNGIWSS
ncbi:putative armadillo-like helical protein [Dioscorea sansibarensis]